MRPEPDTDLAGTVRERVAEILGTASAAEVALARRMVLGFPAKAERLLREHDAAVGSGARADATRAVHTLKGTALNLGLPALARACQDLEDAVRGGRQGTDVRALRSRVEHLVAAGSALLADEGRALP